MIDPPIFPFAGGLNGDDPIPDQAYEDLFEEDCLEDEEQDDE